VPKTCRNICDSRIDVGRFGKACAEPYQLTMNRADQTRGKRLKIVNCYIVP
jgi:hypothetical protein